MKSISLKTRLIYYAVLALVSVFCEYFVIHSLNLAVTQTIAQLSGKNMAKYFWGLFILYPVGFAVLTEFFCSLYYNIIIAYSKNKINIDFAYFFKRYNILMIAKCVVLGLLRLSYFFISSVLILFGEALFPLITLLIFAILFYNKNKKFIEKEQLKTSVLVFYVPILIFGFATSLIGVFI